MSIFIIIFLVFFLMMLAMAIGVIYGRRPIQGSCGGLSIIGVERACGCKESCRNTAEKISDKNYGN